jgi:hypothetical protein
MSEVEPDSLIDFWRAIDDLGLFFVFRRRPLLSPVPSTNCFDCCICEKRSSAISEIPESVVHEMAGILGEDELGKVVLLSSSISIVSISWSKSNAIPEK